MKLSKNMIIVAVMLVALLVMSIPVIAYAVGGSGSNGWEAEQNLVKSNINFVDNNEDGICDSCGNNCVTGLGLGIGFIDHNGDGICDNLDTGSGAGFVDADDDGICDNRGDISKDKTNTPIKKGIGNGCAGKRR